MRAKTGLTIASQFFNFLSHIPWEEFIPESGEEAPLLRDARARENRRTLEKVLTLVDGLNFKSPIYVDAKDKCNDEVKNLISLVDNCPARPEAERFCDIAGVPKGHGCRTLVSNLLMKKINPEQFEKEFEAKFGRKVEARPEGTEHVTVSLK